MSIKRQLFLAIIFISTFALIGSVFSSIYNSRLYLIQQLQLKNQDNANAMALSLSQAKNDLVKIKLAVSAQFDTGNYERIRFVDSKGEVVVEEESSQDIRTVPAWFVSAIGLDVPTGQAKVTAGWNQLGTIFLVSQKQYAYEALWKSTIEAVWVSFLSIGIGIVLAGMILNKFKAPLERLIDQVKNLPEKKFTDLSHLDVVELKSLNEAMNISARRLKVIFEEEERNIESLKHKINFDELTGLMNRHFLLIKFQESVNSDDIKYNGCAIFRVVDLAKINQQRGRVFGDSLLKFVGQHLSEFFAIDKSGFVGRLSSADFLVVFASDDTERFMEAVNDHLIDELRSGFDEGLSLAVGVTDFDRAEDSSMVLSRADIALAQSELARANKPCFKRKKLFLDGEEYHSGIEDYFSLISQSLVDKKFKLLSHPLISPSGNLIHYEAPLQMVLSDGGTISAGKFLPIADRKGISQKLDFVALELAMKELDANSSIRGLAINLSYSTLTDAPAMNLIKKAIAESQSSSKLWLDIPEMVVIQHPELITDLIAQLHQVNLRVGIKHFGDQLDKLSDLRTTGVDYIKVDSTLIREMGDKTEAQDLLERLVAFSHELGLMVFAEGVQTEGEIGFLKTLGFDGMTGKGVQINNSDEVS
jgi:EAL domain-containing protein (putative c-di-GMP-specific phosphodiesterase class I)/GGDEF domain-containing protein